MGQWFFQTFEGLIFCKGYAPPAQVLHAANIDVHVDMVAWFVRGRARPPSVQSDFFRTGCCARLSNQITSNQTG